MTTVTASEAERLAALAALAIGQEPTSRTPAPARIIPTGREVYAGGTVPRRLVREANLAYRETGGRLLVADAGLGDVVLLTPEQADRLDRLEVTVDVQADLDEVAAEQADTTASDEVLTAMSATDLIAYVTQLPDERARVRLLEEARVRTSRKGSGPRTTVLAATMATPLEDDEAAARILLADAQRQDLEAQLVAGTIDDVDPVRGQATPVPGVLLDPLATIGTPDRPAPLNLP